MAISHDLINLDHYRKSGEKVNLDGSDSIDEHGPYDQVDPINRMPFDGINNTTTPDRLLRHAELKRKKAEKKNAKKLGGLALVVVVAGLGIMNISSAEPKGPSVRIKQGETVSDAIMRYDEEVRHGAPDMGYVYTETDKVVERELNGNSLVHVGDVIHVDPDSGVITKDK